MLHRNKREADVHKGKWNGLGGKFLSGETPEECVEREVREESGLSIRNPRFKGILTFPSFKPAEDWIVFVFTADEFEGELTECDEGELAWVDTEKLKELNLWEGDKYFLDWINKNQFFSAKFIYQDQQYIKHDVTFY